MARLSVRWQLKLYSRAISPGNKSWQRDIDDIVERVLGPRYIPPKPQNRPEVFGQCMYFLELADIVLRREKSCATSENALAKKAAV